MANSQAYLKWGGGQDAMREKSTGQTMLTPADARSLIDVLQANDWIPGPPPSGSADTDATEERVIVSGRFDGARFNWREDRDSESIEKVLKAFGAMASRRDASRVDRLARPKTSR